MREDNKAASTDPGYLAGRGWLCRGPERPVSSAGGGGGSAEKRNRKQMRDVISQNSPNSEKPQTSLVP